MPVRTLIGGWKPKRKVVVQDGAPVTTISGFIPSYTHLQPWLNRVCWGCNYLITRGAPCCVFWNLVLTPQYSKLWRSFQGWSNLLSCWRRQCFFYRLVFFFGCPPTFTPLKVVQKVNFSWNGTRVYQKNRGFGLLSVIFMFHVPLVKNISQNNQVDDGSYHLNTLKTSCLKTQLKTEKVTYV